MKDLIQVTVKGEEELRRFLAKAPAEIREAAHQTMREVASDIKDTAQLICPVRTGFLRRSIHYAQTAFMMFRVTAEAFYAGFVEFGTSRMLPRSFMRPAVQSVSIMAAQRVATRIRSLLERIA